MPSQGHARRGKVHAQPGAVQIDAHDMAEGHRGLGVDAAEVDDSRVVHQHRDRTEELFGVIEYRSPVGFLDDIQTPESRVPAE